MKYWNIEFKLNDGKSSFLNVVAKNLTAVMDYVRRTGGDTDAIVFASSKDVDVVED